MTKSKKALKETMLTPSQELALEFMKIEGQNIFITGSAGTGKSFLISWYRKFHNKKITVLSSTGTGAVIVGGRTANSYFSLGTMTEDFHIIMNRIFSNEKLLNKLRNLKEVIIDEVSMLSGRTFNMIDMILKEVKMNELPFGGVRFICVGDFHQIPPVDTINGKKDFAFVSSSWRNAHFQAFTLREFMRQTDVTFLEVLNNIRQGVCTDRDDAFIKALALKPGEEFEGTRLFGKKDKVHAYNMKKLEEIKAPMREYWTEFTGDPTAIARLKKNLPIQDVFQVKVGALVMFRVNDNKNEEYVNGTLGHVVSLNYDSILIKKMDGVLVNLKKHTFELRNGDNLVISTAYNFALNISYALTTHKSQGASISRLIVDLSQTWDYSMVYVSLSRAESAEGLRVMGWHRNCVGADPLVKRYYDWIDKKQNQIENELNFSNKGKNN